MNKIRIRHGDNELELEGTDSFIKKQLEAFYSRIGLAQSAQPTRKLKQVLIESSNPTKSTAIPAPAEYYKSKGRTDGISQVLIFARYLEEYQKETEFTQAKVNAIAKEAKLSKDIHSQYFTNAVKQGLLRAHPGGKYSLTLSAEELLASM
jgi:hypothetical protein